MPDPSLRGPLTSPGDARPGTRSAVLHALGDRRRRAVLAVLADGLPPVTERTLAHEVAAREQPATLDPQVLQSVRISLVHVQLPVLVAAGLVEDTPAGVVPTDRLDALVRTCPVQSLLDESLPVSPQAVDRGLALLAHPTRRRGIEELAARRRLSLDELAEALVVGAGRGPVTPDHRDRTALELHHVHVPKLVDAGVVARDGHDLRYLGDAFLEEWWFTQ